MHEVECTRLLFWRITVPNPFLLASICSTVSLYLLKYGRTIVFLNAFFNAANADQCSSVMLYCASLRMGLLSGGHSSPNHGLYQFKKLMRRRYECMVSLSFGNSILRIESIFFGSGVIPCEFH